MCMGFFEDGTTRESAALSRSVSVDEESTRQRILSSEQTPPKAVDFQLLEADSSALSDIDTPLKGLLRNAPTFGAQFVPTENFHRATCIPFWMFFTVEENEITGKVHHALGMTEEDANAYIRCIREVIYSVYFEISRRLLLYQLHESRVADPLLIPPNMDDIHRSVSISGDLSVMGMSMVHAELQPGSLGCLGQATVQFGSPERVQLSDAVASVEAAFLSISVTNRPHFFVIRSKNKRIFYFRIRQVNEVEKEIFLDIFGTEALPDDLMTQLMGRIESTVSEVFVATLSSLLSRNPRLRISDRDWRYVARGERLSLQVPVPPDVTEPYLLMLLLQQVLSMDFQRLQWNTGNVGHVRLFDRGNDDVCLVPVLSEFFFWYNFARPEAGQRQAQSVINTVSKQALAFKAATGTGMAAMFVALVGESGLPICWPIPSQIMPQSAESNFQSGHRVVDLDSPKLLPQKEKEKEKVGGSSTPKRFDFIGGKFAPFFQCVQWSNEPLAFVELDVWIPSDLQAAVLQRKLESCITEAFHIYQLETFYFQPLRGHSLPGLHPTASRMLHQGIISLSDSSPGSVVMKSFGISLPSASVRVVLRSIMQALQVNKIGKLTLFECEPKGEWQRSDFMENDRPLLSREGSINGFRTRFIMALVINPSDMSMERLHEKVDISHVAKLLASSKVGLDSATRRGIAIFVTLSERQLDVCLYNVNALEADIVVHVVKNHADWITRRHSALDSLFQIRMGLSHRHGKDSQLLPQFNPAVLADILEPASSSMGNDILPTKRVGSMVDMSEYSSSSSLSSLRDGFHHGSVFPPFYGGVEVHRLSDTGRVPDPLDFFGKKHLDHAIQSKVQADQSERLANIFSRWEQAPPTENPNFIAADDLQVLYSSSRLVHCARLDMAFASAIGLEATDAMGQVFLTEYCRHLTEDAKLRLVHLTATPPDSTEGDLQYQWERLPATKHEFHMGECVGKSIMLLEVKIDMERAVLKVNVYVVDASPTDVNSDFRIQFKLQREARNPKVNPKEITIANISHVRANLHTNSCIYDFSLHVAYSALREWEESPLPESERHHLSFIPILDALIGRWHTPPSFARTSLWRLAYDHADPVLLSGDHWENLELLAEHFNKYHLQCSRQTRAVFVRIPPNSALRARIVEDALLDSEELETRDHSLEYVVLMVLPVHEHDAGTQNLQVWVFSVDPSSQAPLGAASFRPAEGSPLAQVVCRWFTSQLSQALSSAMVVLGLRRLHERLRTGTIAESDWALVEESIFQISLLRFDPTLEFLCESLASVSSEAVWLVLHRHLGSRVCRVNVSECPHFLVSHPTDKMPYIVLRFHHANQTVEINACFAEGGNFHLPTLEEMEGTQLLHLSDVMGETEADIYADFVSEVVVCLLRAVWKRVIA